jgi:hypothetical protein
VALFLLHLEPLLDLTSLWRLWEEKEEKVLEAGNEFKYSLAPIILLLAPSPTKR